MNYFIKNIHVNNLFHLNDFDIPIADEKYPHLIITGKNGSGKTVILNAVSDFLNIIKNDKSANFLTYKNSLHYWDDRLKNETDENHYHRILGLHIDIWEPRPHSSPQGIRTNSVLHWVPHTLD